MKNDAASVSAAADKIAAQMQKVAASVAAAQQVMTSDAMVRAIENAERLAAALAAINATASHKITFAVIDNKAPT